jgi:hypothetical protein
MNHENYTQSEAQALLGRHFENLIEFSGLLEGDYRQLPLGTHGRVISSELLSSDGYNVVVEWEVPRSAFGIIPPALRTSFGKEIMQGYTQEVTSDKSAV